MEYPLTHPLGLPQERQGPLSLLPTPQYFLYRAGKGYLKKEPPVREEPTSQTWFSPYLEQALPFLEQAIPDYVGKPRWYITQRVTSYTNSGQYYVLGEGGFVNLSSISKSYSIDLTPKRTYTAHQLWVWLEQEPTGWPETWVAVPQHYWSNNGL